jgi:hypothetical protein
MNTIFKKGKKNETSDYRPISLLTSFSKVFEKLIYNRLYHRSSSSSTLAKNSMDLEIILLLNWPHSIQSTMFYNSLHIFPRVRSELIFKYKIGRLRTLTP